MPLILFPLKGVSGFAPYRKDYLLKMALGKEGQEEQVNTKNPHPPLLCVSLIKGYSVSFFSFFFKVIKDMEAYLDTMSPVIDVMSQLYKEKGLDTDEKV